LRLGIISDTHGLLRPEVFKVFAKVDYILHAGDIGSVDIITELEALAPLYAVWGNTDGPELRRVLPEVVQMRLEGFDFLVVHGHQLGSPTPEALHQRWPDAEVIIYGHTHMPLLETVDQVVTVMNPGGAGARRFDLPASVGIMELEPGIPPRARLVPLTGADED
jgi:putative phosphoesterase